MPLKQCVPEINTPLNPPLVPRWVLILGMPYSLAFTLLFAFVRFNFLIPPTMKRRTPQTNTLNIIISLCLKSYTHSHISG